MDKSPNIKTNLKRETTIFMTFRDMFCNTDLYVLNFLYNKIKSGKSNIDYLNKLLVVYDNVPKEVISVIPYGKRHRNPILEFVDYDKLDKCDYVAVFDDMYNEILYNDKSNIFEGLELTNLSNSLAPLLNDDLLKSITIQVDKMTNAIYAYIYDRFAKTNADKVKIVEGFLGDAITADYDDYFLPDAKYVDSVLSIERKNQIDVMIPELITTLELDSDHNPIKPHKLKLGKSPMEYRDKYMMNILSIKIPI